MVNIKKQIALALSKIRQKENPIVYLEQYELDSESAARFMHNVITRFKGKEIIDAGAGSGALTLASSLLDFERIIAIDIDISALKRLKENMKYFPSWKIDLVASDYLKFNSSRKLDAVITNPPFGTKKRHRDKEFLLKSFELADEVFSLHKSGNDEFFKKLAEEFGFELFKLDDFIFYIKRKMEFHRKPKYPVIISQYYFKRKNG